MKGVKLRCGTKCELRCAPALWDLIDQFFAEQFSRWQCGCTKLRVRPGVLARDRKKPENQKKTHGLRCLEKVLLKGEKNVLHLHVLQVVKVQKSEKAENVLQVAC